VRLLPGVQPTADAKATDSSVRIAYHFRHYDRGGGRILSEMPADAATNHLLIGLRTAAQPRIDFDQRLRQPLASTLKHRAFFFGPPKSWLRSTRKARRSACSQQGAEAAGDSDSKPGSGEVAGRAARVSPPKAAGKSSQPPRIAANSASSSLPNIVPITGAFALPFADPHRPISS